MQADHFRAGTASAAVRKNKSINKMRNLHQTPKGPGQKSHFSFVPGDAARGGEGNGLGLSIARSLTELQKGTLELTVDGDLFKVVLRFSELS